MFTMRSQSNRIEIFQIERTNSPTSVTAHPQSRSHSRSLLPRVAPCSEHGGAFWWFLRQGTDSARPPASPGTRLDAPEPIFLQTPYSTRNSRSCHAVFEETSVREDLRLLLDASRAQARRRPTRTKSGLPTSTSRLEAKSTLLPTHDIANCRLARLLGTSQRSFSRTAKRRLRMSRGEATPK